MNRPEDLRRALASVLSAENPPEQIIVSDDSADDRAARQVASEFTGVTFQRGPRRGLGPNRNACINTARESHLMFIDDDVVVPREIFTAARRLAAEAGPKVILSGYELNYGSANAEPRKVVPHNADFWGLQRVPTNGHIHAIVINAAIFPRELFNRALFDDIIRYGCEEIDLARHAVALGYEIRYTDDLFVHHHPSPVNRQQYSKAEHSSRLYATLKAYWWYERSPLKSLSFALLGPLQLVASATRRAGPAGTWRALQASALAIQYVRKSAPWRDSV